ncbi:cupredoxin domain-containing protein [Mariniluteicoccus flavus]
MSPRTTPSVRPSLSPRRLLSVVAALLAVAVLAACQSAAPAPAPSGPIELKITIAGGRVDPSGAKIEVPKGATVHVTATSDAPDSIHVHGYDREVEVGPGKPADFTFVADKIGQFEVESHHPPRVIARLNIR